MRRNLASAILALMLIAIAAATIYRLSGPAAAPGPATAPTVAVVPASAPVAPATRPNPSGGYETTDRITAIASPPDSELAPSSDPEVNRLLDAYNAAQSRLLLVSFSGGCEWTSAAAARKRGR
ncbi:MAG TPA: hypothetical protein VH518_14200, partial [Tepidisphaeraceae bacterium]